MRLFRALLWLYPNEFRERFHQEMCRVLSDRLREEKTPSAQLAAWISAIVGVFTYAPRSTTTCRYKISLFDLTPQDPATIAFAAMLLSLVAFLAGYLPARHAGRLDPMTALRTE